MPSKVFYILYPINTETYPDAVNNQQIIFSMAFPPTQRAVPKADHPWLFRVRHGRQQRHGSQTAEKRWPELLLQLLIIRP